MDTTPLPRPDGDPVPAQPRRVGTGCRRGHTGRSGPGENRELGQVPGRISAWFGAVVLALICTAVWIWLPGARPWLLAGLGTWYVVTFAIQAALGHRGRCLVRREPDGGSSGPQGPSWTPPRTDQPPGAGTGTGSDHGRAP